MIRYFLFLSILCVSVSAAGVVESSHLTLGSGFSEVVRIPNLERAAVANSKIVKVRAFPPDQLLVTGLFPGTTTLQAWSKGGKESPYVITVVSSELFDQLSGREQDGVVKIALEFLELDSALTRNLGLRWPEAAQVSGALGLQGTGNTSGLNYTVSFSSARGMIQHLLREGWAKVLANPDLYVRMGEEATFHSGGEFPVPTSSENYGRYLRHIEWKPFGITVKVRPKSADNLHFSSDIKVEMSELNSGSAVEGIPALTKRQVETKMNSLDGETVILSGLVRQSSSRTKEGLPFLSSIPLLGYLFASKGEAREETEIFMAVTFSLSNRVKDRENIQRFRDRFHESVGD